MLRRRVAIAGALILGIGLTGSSLIGQEVTLRYRWTEGEALRYRITTESSTDMTGVPGMGSMNVRSKLTQVQQMTPTSVAGDGTATLQVLFESIRMDVSSPGMSMSYDSSAPNQSDPMGAQLGMALQPFVGETITIVLSPHGVVERVDGLARLTQKVQQNIPQAGGLGGPNPLSSLVSEDGLRGSFAQSFASLPDRPVRAGDTWKVETKLPNNLGAMTTSSTMTVKGFETVGGNEIARIVLTHRIATSPGGAAAGGMPVQIGDGTGEGELLFDHRRGRVQRATTQVTLPMTIGGSMQSTAKTTTTMELIER